MNQEIKLKPIHFLFIFSGICGVVLMVYFGGPQHALISGWISILLGIAFMFIAPWKEKQRIWVSTDVLMGFFFIISGLREAYFPNLELCANILMGVALVAVIAFHFLKKPTLPKEP